MYSNLYISTLSHVHILKWIEEKNEKNKNRFKINKLFSIYFVYLTFLYKD